MRTETRLSENMQLKASGVFRDRNFAVCSFVLSAAPREGEPPFYAQDLLHWLLGLRDLIG